MSRRLLRGCQLKIAKPDSSDVMAEHFQQPPPAATQRQIWSSESDKLSGNFPEVWRENPSSSVLSVLTRLIIGNINPRFQILVYDRFMIENFNDSFKYSRVFKVIETLSSLRLISQ